ncbi:MAG: ShlB/FhaC/HecB family hemolysin secretion/activation protein [Solirubrobacteraceae bacterium]
MHRPDSVAGKTDMRKGVLGFANLAMALACALHAGRSQAQGVPRSLPAPVQPTSPLERITPPARPEEQPPLVVQPLPGNEAPPGAERVEITLSSLDVEGNTIYSQAQIQAIFADSIGKRVPLTRLFDLANRLEARYRADGYVLTRVLVPEQTATGGKFRLRAIEGYVSDVVIEGDAGGVMPLIKSYADRIKAAHPANIKVIERYLLLINDTPGVSATGVLRPGSQLGASQLVLDVKVKHFDGFATVDNRGSRYTGPWGASIGAASNSFTRFGERVEGIFFSTFDDEQHFGQVSLSGTVLPDGTRLQLTAGISPSNPGYTLTPLRVQSITETVGVHALTPWVRSRQFNLNSDIGLAVVQSHTDVLGSRFNDDQLRILVLGGSADYRDGWNGLTTGKIDLRQGLGILGASPTGLERSTPNGQSDALAAIGEVSRLQSVKSWNGRSITAYAVIDGQTSSAPLLAEEQFQLGGQRFGRGYPPADLLGNQALAGSAELQFNNTTRWKYLPSYQTYAFYDFGAVWNIVGRQTLASAGIGVRFTVSQPLSIQVELARPLTRIPDDQSGKGVQAYVAAAVRF